MCLTLNTIPQCLNIIVFFYFSQDTISIKKRSSRTRRIRPVSTRLSEYCCLSSFPPLPPHFTICCSSDYILSLSVLRLSFLSTPFLLSRSEKHMSAYVSQYISEQSLIVLTEMMFPCNSHVSSPRLCLLSFTSSIILSSLFAAIRSV